MSVITCYQLYRFATRRTGGCEALQLFHVSASWCCAGIYTHHQRRSNPNLYAINIACLEGVDPTTLKYVKTLDGETHPSDKGKTVAD